MMFGEAYKLRVDLTKRVMNICYMFETLQFSIKQSDEFYSCRSLKEIKIHNTCTYHKITLNILVHLVTYM